MASLVGSEMTASPGAKERAARTPRRPDAPGTSPTVTSACAAQARQRNTGCCAFTVLAWPGKARAAQSVAESGVPVQLARIRHMLAPSKNSAQAHNLQLCTFSATCKRRSQPEKTVQRISASSAQQDFKQLRTRHSHAQVCLPTLEIQIVRGHTGWAPKLSGCARGTHAAATGRHPARELFTSTVVCGARCPGRTGQQAHGWQPGSQLHWCKHGIAATRCASSVHNFGVQ